MTGPSQRPPRPFPSEPVFRLHETLFERLVLALERIARVLDPYPDRRPVYGQDTEETEAPPEPDQPTT